MTNITRGRACAIIRQADRLLLNRYGGDSFWALPGGAVEQGEFSTDALAREMREELDIAVEIGRLVWIVENLFDYRGTSYTEYCRARLPPGRAASAAAGVPERLGKHCAAASAA
ncbi:MAG TPA: NUDIX domain-containing protein [Dongiaceae bacterium]|nr:NUDIX domain-containing protein [Dongiaceae bacterium]